MNAVILLTLYISVCHFFKNIIGGVMGFEIHLTWIFNEKCYIAICDASSCFGKYVGWLQLLLQLCEMVTFIGSMQAFLCSVTYYDLF
jgi:hypothetical protein